MAKFGAVLLAAGSSVRAARAAPVEDVSTDDAPGPTAGGGARPGMLKPWQGQGPTRSKTAMRLIPQQEQLNLYVKTGVVNFPQNTD